MIDQGTADEMTPIDRRHTDPGILPVEDPQAPSMQEQIAKVKITVNEDLGIQCNPFERWRQKRGQVILPPG